MGLIFIEDIKDPVIINIFREFNEISKHRYFINYHIYTNPTIVPSHTHVFELIKPLENKLVFANTEFVSFIKETLKHLYNFKEKYSDEYVDEWLINCELSLIGNKYYYTKLKYLVSKVIPDNILNNWEDELKMIEELKK